MSFAKDINTLIKSATNIYAAVGGSIFYENIPDNFSLERPFIVYSFSNLEPLRILSGVKVADIYELSLKIVHKNTADLETTTSLVIEFLDNKSSGDIKNIEFLNDNRLIDLEKTLYQNECSFKCIYIK